MALVSNELKTPHNKTSSLGSATASPWDLYHLKDDFDTQFEPEIFATL